MRDGWVAGIDLGGTNVRIAAVAPEGRIGPSLTRPLDRTAPADPPFAQLVGLVGELREAVGDGGPRAVGLGATGPVDPVGGTIANPWTLPPSMQGPARDVLQAALGLRVVVENDADAAALGEAWLGAGRGASSVACLTVGTGIGVGVVRDLELHRGPAGLHPEAGHHVVDPTGPRCYCGSHGCVESWASASAVVDRARALGAPEAEEGPRAVFAAAAAGDERCGEVVASAERALVLAVRNLVAMHGVEVVVLAGNAIGEPERLVAGAQAALDDYAFTPAGGTRVARGELGDGAGCAGAARLVLGP